MSPSGAPSGRFLVNRTENDRENDTVDSSKLFEAGTPFNHNNSEWMIINVARRVNDTTSVGRMNQLALSANNAVSPLVLITMHLVL
jgi:hypothetical protein